MKKFKIYLLACIIITTSCDDRWDFEEKNNTPPIAYFNNNQELTELRDSLKTSIKNGTDHYAFRVTPFDGENLLTDLSFKLVNGTGRIQIANETITQAVISTKAEPIDIKFYPEETGSIVELLFTTRDFFNATHVAELTLFVFDNLAPVAEFTYQQTSVNSRFEVTFDARASKDLDKRQGGLIEFYEYVLPNRTIRTKLPVQTIDFPGAGNYNVTLRVYDNDGASSTGVTKLITISE